MTSLSVPRFRIAIAALFFGALVLFFLLLRGVAHAGAGPVAAPPPDPLGWPEYLAVGLAALAGIKAIIDVLLAGLKWLAPRTATSIDDTARDDLQLVHDKLDALSALVGRVAPNSKPQQAGPPSSSASLTIVLLLLGLASMGSALTACAGSGTVVKREATYLEGCSVADAAQIITAGKAIADDAKALKAGADRAAAAIDVIAQLALIHDAYARCKATAEKPAPVAFCNSSCWNDAYCTGIVACSKCVSGTCQGSQPVAELEPIGAPPPERPGRAAFESYRASVAGGASFRTAAGDR